jgi:23S rRNA (guanine745-N1)-methyltransferase
MAARHYKDTCFIVASIKEPLPIASSTMRVLLNIFAPRNAAEFARVLVPDGLLLVVIPGPNHLQPLRNQLSLLNIEEDKQQHVIQQFAPFFNLHDTFSLTYQLPLDRPAITSLVRMTPNYWHLSEQARKAMEEIEEVQTEIAFICLAFIKP